MLCRTYPKELRHAVHRRFPVFRVHHVLYARPQQHHGAFMRKHVWAQKKPPLLFRRPAGRFGDHGGVRAVRRDVIPFFAGRGTRNACRRRGLYPLDGLWHLALKGRG